MSKYVTEVFNKISDEKRARVLTAAIQEFANHGFAEANINIIAAKADVSVGSLYKYFTNKQNLYLYLIECNVLKVNGILKDIIEGSDNLKDTIENIIITIQKHAKVSLHETKLYNSMTTENSAELVWKIASEMEGATADLYHKLIQKAKDNGEISCNTNARHAAFFLDNLFILLQFSYSCEYYRERFKMFVGEAGLKDDKTIQTEMMSFINGALGFQS